MKKIILLFLLFVGIAGAQSQLVRKDNLGKFLNSYTGLNDSIKLAAALTDIGSANVNLLLEPKTYAFGIQTIPSNINLIVPKGCLITDSLVINGGLEAGLYKIFSSGVALEDAEIDGVRPEWFGDNATPGTTDMSTAFQRAKRSVLTATYPEGCTPILLSATDYLITENNVLGADITGMTGSKRGLVIKGVGYSSQIHFKPTSGDTAYLYDGGSDTSTATQNALIGMTLESFAIIVNPTHGAGLINLFRITGKSGYVSSNWRFRDLYIYGDDFDGSTDKSGAVILLASKVNNSESTIENCYIKYFRTLLDMRGNNEAVVWNISNTNAELMRGDVIRVEGGGSIRWDGGSVINDTKDHTATGDNIYEFNLLRWLYGTQNASFNNIRTEIRGVDADSTARVLTAGLREYDTDISSYIASSLAYLGSSIGIITFNNCDFSHTWINRDIVKIEAQGRMTINFNNCYMIPYLASETRESYLEIVDVGDSTVGGVSTGLHYGTGSGNMINFRDGWAIPDTNIVFGEDSADVYTRVSITATRSQNVKDYIKGRQDPSGIPINVNLASSYPTFPATFRSYNNLQARFLSTHSLSSWSMGMGWSGYYTGSLVFHNAAYLIDSTKDPPVVTSTTYSTTWFDSTGNLYTPKLATGLKWTSGTAWTTPTTTIDSTGLTTDYLVVDSAAVIDTLTVSSLLTYDRLDKLDTLLIPFGLDDLTGTDASHAIFIDRAITISKLWGVVGGDGGVDDSCAINICWASARNDGSPSTLFSSDVWLNDYAEGEIHTSFDDATIPKNVWVWLRCTNEDGTVNFCDVTLRAMND